MCGGALVVPFLLDITGLFVELLWLVGCGLMVVDVEVAVGVAIDACFVPSCGLLVECMDAFGTVAFG